MIRPVSGAKTTTGDSCATGRIIVHGTEKQTVVIRPVQRGLVKSQPTLVIRSQGNLATPVRQDLSFLEK